ncbi:MAG: hypothetical protein A2621_03490 [Alphaproteobacteria bacterium RIFCSPHIGHO2_01_FULL_41_14]|nr:MAG: hypothetical protein A2065_03525 [Alphaproteobacteria bacterium GWB1_45_5]OFW75833.1 MAG: hypothetical protein A3K20_03290 [Alphaproteobacteria bacterium GWA1_45_9]OFW89920.1 MAG: hypothetical protein A2621_03490 [Alphaproteobacteria bacterium RIFCSPHIGHO2_01_FULL_41_14]
MFDVVIYQPPKSAVQLGCGQKIRWVLEFVQKRAHVFDPQTGWCGTTEPFLNHKLFFSSIEQAIRFAEKAHLTYLCC